MVTDADVVLHAGDIKTDEFLDRLASTAMTYAVAGNNDVDMTEPPPAERRLDLAGVPLAMVHDAGPALGRARRMRRRFPDAALVVFGHSHIPVDVLGADGQRLFNPGSPTWDNDLAGASDGRAVGLLREERARMPFFSRCIVTRFGESCEMQPPRAGFAGPVRQDSSRGRGG